MEPDGDKTQLSLTRVRLYREFLGKEAESSLIASFVKRLAEGYGIATESNENLCVVDVGCGIGRMLHHFAIEYNWNTLAIEPDADYYNESVKVANKLCNDFPEAKLEVMNVGFTGIPLRNHYQVIMAINGPFYYLLTPQERFDALQVVYDALAPGGIVLLDMANFQYLLQQLGPVGGTCKTPNQADVSSAAEFFRFLFP